MCFCRGWVPKTYFSVCLEVGVLGCDLISAARCLSADLTADSVWVRCQSSVGSFLITCSKDHTFQEPAAGTAASRMWQRLQFSQGTGTAGLLWAWLLEAQPEACYLGPCNGYVSPKVPTLSPFLVMVTTLFYHRTGLNMWKHRVFYFHSMGY